ncbi:MAG: hypothetical protein KatS3mg053_3050 [Candidatus Roseilinea sp.]|nr:MAG: hypothetical protein KatS3mg053_3050 [Candidatus Roseilinea sp.]
MGIALLIPAVFEHVEQDVTQLFVPTLDLINTRLARALEVQ